MKYISNTQTLSIGSKMGIWISCILLLLAAPVFSNEVSDIIKADALQKKIIRNLQNTIVNYHLTIQKQYKYIKQTGLIKGKTTRIPIVSERQSSYGRKDRHVYSAEAIIHWSGSYINWIHFKERDAILKSYNQKQRHWLGQASVDTHEEYSKEEKKNKKISTIDGYFVDFLTLNVNEYGNSNVILFRLNTATDTNNKTIFYKVPKHGVMPSPIIRYVEEAQNRINILREYRKLITALDHRIKYFTRKARSGNENRLEYLLP